MTDRTPTTSEVIGAFVRAMTDVDRERLARGESMIPTVTIFDRAMANLYGEKSNDRAA